MTTKKLKTIRKKNKRNKTGRRNKMTGGMPKRLRPEEQQQPDKTLRTVETTPPGEGMSATKMPCTITETIAEKPGPAAGKGSDLFKEFFGKIRTDSPAILPIEALILGGGEPASDTYGSKIITSADIQALVNQIKVGEIYFITIPMPPGESHSIIVCRRPEVVNIIDWNGGITESGILTRYLGSDKKADKETKIKWSYYTNLINCLQKEFCVPIRFLPVDTKSAIYEAAKSKCTITRMGGCAEYNYGWLDTYVGRRNYRLLGL